MPSSNGPLWRLVLQLISQEPNLLLSSESPSEWRPLPGIFSPIYTWRKAGLVAVIVWPSQNPNLDYVTLDISGGRRKSKTLSEAKVIDRWHFARWGLTWDCASCWAKHWWVWKWLHVWAEERNRWACREMTKLPAGNIRFEIMEPFEGHVSRSAAILSPCHSNDKSKLQKSQTWLTLLYSCVDFSKKKYDLIKTQKLPKKPNNKHKKLISQTHKLQSLEAN